MERSKTHRKFFKVFALLLAVSFCAFGAACQPIDEIRKRNADDLKTVKFDGVAYLPKNYKHYLLIGLDTEGDMKASGYFRNEVQVDLLMLVSVDETEKTFFLTQINRDTMTLVSEYGLGNRKLGESEMQIALAHTYGDGLKFSCANTVNAVSGLLSGDNRKGITVSAYYAMTTSAVTALMQEMLPDGVSLTLDGDQDYSSVLRHTTWTAGSEITLKGADVLDFCQNRVAYETVKKDGGTNVARQRRQKQFLKAFFPAIKTLPFSEERWMEIYDAVAPKTCTNLTVKQVESFRNVLGSYTFSGTVHDLPGEPYYPDDPQAFAEFHVDEAALKTFVKDTFFTLRTR